MQSKAKPDLSGNPTLPTGFSTKFSTAFVGKGESCGKHIFLADYCLLHPSEPLLPDGYPFPPQYRLTGGICNFAAFS